jgi:hypothetical protein
MKKKVQIAIAGLALFVAGVAAGQGVNPRRNPNIFEAQRYCHMAIDKIVAAQQANEYDMQGHAENAKNLLQQAIGELKAAADAANRR